MRNLIVTFLCTMPFICCAMQKTFLETVLPKQEFPTPRLVTSQPIQVLIACLCTQTHKEQDTCIQSCVQLFLHNRLTEQKTDIIHLKTDFAVNKEIRLEGGNILSIAGVKYAQPYSVHTQLLYKISQDQKSRLFTVTLIKKLYTTVHEKAGLICSSAQ